MTIERSRGNLRSGSIFVWLGKLTPAETRKSDAEIRSDANRSDAKIRPDHRLKLKALSRDVSLGWLQSNP